MSISFFFLQYKLFWKCLWFFGGTHLKEYFRKLRVTSLSRLFAAAVFILYEIKSVFFFKCHQNATGGRWVLIDLKITHKSKAGIIHTKANNELSNTPWRSRATVVSDCQHWCTEELKSHASRCEESSSKAANTVEIILISNWFPDLSVSTRSSFQISPCYSSVAKTNSSVECEPFQIFHICNLQYFIYEFSCGKD